MTGRLLGVDFGTRRVGLAVCDPDRLIASPLTTLERTDAQRDADVLRRVVADELVVAVVVGLPVHTDGREGVKAKEAREFGAWLGRAVSRPVRFWDERFTTAQAESALWAAGLTHRRRKERRDRVAAQILLQSYLDAGCPADEGAAPL